ncbi:MAG TPA: OmpA family protein [Phycisphaerae bacterium]|nr:OmpA family protein [Phycisphaerae bacterium]
MAWMTRNPALTLSLTALFLTLGVTGCGPDAKQKKIDELTAENDGLKQEIEDRDRQLNDAMVRENDSKSTIDELNQQLAKARADGKNSEGWVTMPSFDMISVPGSVLFEAGKADLTSGGRAKLAQIASDIRAKYSDRDIFVFGHTDDQPIRKSKWKDNWELGANRSLKVIRALSELGIPNDSLVQANCGQYRPKTSNTNDKARLQNRRVEFYAVKKNAGAIDGTSARGTSDE